MRSDRERWREARLLLIVAALSEGESSAEAVDVFALDFLLQHPSLLRAFLRSSKLELPANVVPSEVEAESSEEALLRWKRSVSARILAPMVGRLIARGLIRRRPRGQFELAIRGEEIAKQLRQVTGGIERERLARLAALLAMDPRAARQSLLAALAEGSN
jgi:hypothetical protein